VTIGSFINWLKEDSDYSIYQPLISRFNKAEALEVAADGDGAAGSGE
jgi:hypothetical protein